MRFNTHRFSFLLHVVSLPLSPSLPPHLTRMHRPCYLLPFDESLVFYLFMEWALIGLACFIGTLFLRDRMGLR